MTGTSEVDELAALLIPSDDPISIETLLRDVTPDLLKYFVTRLRDREDAADAVADTLVILWRKSRAIPNSHEDARRYSFGVARRVLATARRGEQRRNALADRLRMVVRQETVSDPEPDMELRTALETLSANDRELVLLVAWDGFSVADAGRILGVRPEAARTRYSRARARLRKQLSQQGQARE